MNKKCLIVSLVLLLASGSILCASGTSCPLTRQKPANAPGFYGLFLKAKPRSPEELAAYEQSGGSSVRYRRKAKMAVAA